MEAYGESRFITEANRGFSQNENHIYMEKQTIKTNKKGCICLLTWNSWLMFHWSGRELGLLS